MALQQSRASASEHVIDAGHSVRACGCQLIAGAIKASIQNFVVVPAESLDTLTSANVPKFASAVDRSCKTVVSREVKLSAGKFSRVSLESKQALACAYVPNFRGVIEATCQ